MNRTERIWRPGERLGFKARKHAGLLVVAAVMGPGLLVQDRAYRRTPHISGHLDLTPTSTVGFKLVEVSHEVGVENIHRRATVRAGAGAVAKIAGVGPNSRLATLGASVAVVDFDDDGWPDVYVTNSETGSANKLFRNNRDGTFTDVADKVGLAYVNEPAGSLRPLFFDMDNDGRKDLLLTTFGCPKIFRNTGKRFEEVKDAGNFTCGGSWASNAIDVDGDGRLDIVMAYRYALTKGQRPKFVMHVHSTAHIDPGPLAVYRNVGGKFKRIPGDLGLRNDRGFIHAVGAYDLRGTGRSDIHMARDWAHDLLYYNEGGGAFRDASDAIEQKYSLSGMSSEIADSDNDGVPRIMSTNVFEPGVTVTGNILWKAVRPDRYRDEAGPAGVLNCGFAWGAKWIDLDNDGLQDLVVANGFVTGPTTKNYIFAAMSISQGAQEIVKHPELWPPLTTRSLHGRQQDCVFLNKGGGSFRDVSGEAGIDRDLLDGRAVAAIDYLNNGRPALIVSNDAQALRFYRNDPIGAAGAWIGFKLVGTKRNPDAWGSKVTLRLADGRVMTRELQPGNGFMSQSDDRLHFGLGGGPAIDSIEVRWPSGRRQELSGMAPGRYHTVKEPS
ncbi:MAG: CRTAC1 family protein [Elusimicrobia bacterium]|nr:CRTAC1 family protein [Elusimicrobiota bacterium]